MRELKEEVARERSLLQPYVARVDEANQRARKAESQVRAAQRFADETLMVGWQILSRQPGATMRIKASEFAVLPKGAQILRTYDPETDEEVLTAVQPSGTQQEPMN